MVFVDASALVKRFVREEGTEAVERLLREDSAAVARLTEVELVSAFSRRHRDGSIPAALLERLLAATHEVLSTLPVVELSPTVVRQAQGPLLRHRLSVAEAIQLACCLVLRERLGQPVSFLAFDDRLNEAAVREGLALALPRSLGAGSSGRTDLGEKAEELLAGMGEDGQPATREHPAKETLRRLEERGVLQGGCEREGALAPVARRLGGLQRFLAERE